MAVEVSPTASWEDINSWEGGVSSVEIVCPKEILRDPEDTLNAAPGKGSSNESSTNVGASSTNITSNNGGGRADVSKSMGCVKEGVSPRNGAALPLAVKLPGGGNPWSGDGCRNGAIPKEHENTAEGEIENGSVGREQGGQEQVMAAADPGDDQRRETQPQSQPQDEVDLWRTNGNNPRQEGPQASQRTDSTASDRVSGFHDSICLGFAVALCLNLGSVTARQKGFFTAEVKCNPQGSLSKLVDLGVWVGWSRAVANSKEATSFDLKEMSMVGAIMGVLTVVGHSADAVVNALGCIMLLCTRRKRVKEGQSRAIKVLCLAALFMAGWLLGMTVIGFLLAVEGPVGSAAVAFYSREFDLECDSSVSVSVDYAYAMTTLTILCQFFIGIVALPRPPRWWFCGRKGAAFASAARARSGEASPERGSSHCDPLGQGENQGRRSLPVGVGDKDKKGRGLDPDMLQDGICDPV